MGLINRIEDKPVVLCRTLVLSCIKSYIFSIISPAPFVHPLHEESNMSSLTISITNHKHYTPRVAAAENTLRMFP